ncbi:hypothetical protein POTG_03011 [Paenibacillus sp. oral taxon 786 str. D14]|uniref:hypothetical protein n=1 Tax=Paenibacillus sp. oral taxon 786 TaxID=652715 RepID=UPI0001AFD508|nr:hypothetical protein [Paenibacillus sp. oral taxon 786]EES72403.1 hypothetical protein POTG_03011 [Paenibacillus sp. oral taxon 786 str. D14]
MLDSTKIQLEDWTWKTGEDGRQRYCNEVLLQGFKFYRVRLSLKTGCAGTLAIEVEESLRASVRYPVRPPVKFAAGEVELEVDFYLESPLEIQIQIVLSLEQSKDDLDGKRGLSVGQASLREMPSPEQVRETAEIKLDASKHVIENYKGMGVQWDPFTDYPLDEQQWSKLSARLNHLKPAFLRTMIYGNFYCRGFHDDGGPIFDFENQEYMQPLYRLLDYAQDHQIPIVFGEWEPPIKFVGTPLAGIDADDPRWTEMIGGLLQHLIVVRKYTVIRYYDMVNEVNQPWSLVADFAKWQTGVRLLKSKLAELGLDSQIEVIGPGSVWDPDWIKESVDQMHDVLDAYDIHIYADYNTVVSGEMERIFAAKKEYVVLHDPSGNKKDFYLTEAGMLTGKTDGDSQPQVKQFWYGVSMADLAAQSMRSGLNGIAIWDLDDAMHGQDNGYDKMDARSMKQWGFWNSWGDKLGVPEAEHIRPHYFVWSLMTHLFPKGSQILASGDSGLDGLRSVGMKWVSGGKLDMTYMIVNNSVTPRIVKLRAEGVSEPAIFLREYRYFEDDQRTDRFGYPLPSGIRSNVDLDKGIEVDLPGRGVVILTTMETGSGKKE